MKQLSLFFSNLGKWSKRFFDRIARALYFPEPSLKDVSWGVFSGEGGEKLRFNYPSLNQNAIVFDLGGYEGGWASDIYGRYRPKIYIFEVYTPYYNDIVERFGHNDDIKAFNFGLSSKDTTLEISIDSVSTSAFKKSNDMVEIELKKASEFFAAHQITKIDLMKINIEGGEYDLLEHLVTSGFVSNIDNIQVQFHDFVPNAVAEMNGIREKLSATHYPTYKFDFVWDNWKLKGKQDEAPFIK